MKKTFFLFVILIECNLYFSCEKFPALAGSNGYAENYNMHTSKEKLINAIKVFKEENPNMIPPETNRNWSDYYSSPFYCVHFYYIDKDLVLVADVNGSTLQFISVCSSTEVEGEKLCRGVNDDITGKENKAVKKEFENRIVKPLKEILDRK